VGLLHLHADPTNFDVIGHLNLSIWKLLLPIDLLPQIPVMITLVLGGSLLALPI
jgi:hypothetical protein